MISAFERRLNLMVGFPTTGDWKGKFGISLCNMVTYLMSEKVPGFREQRVRPQQVRGSILPRGRMNVVKSAIADKCTHILFVDTDQTFPRDTAHRLLTSGKSVIGCNIATKQIPASTTARQKSEDFWGEPVFTDPDSPQYEKVWRLGCGIMLLDIKVFEKIGLGCFGIPWIEKIQDYQGEDWPMCEALEAAGISIWVDHKLSDEIKHIGDYEYGHDVVGSKELVPVFDKIIGEA